ncbi:SUMF1/EgtB/PvdO family nonheme iron enzyme [bacterium]|nr:SUMF1/EgtB/PvdO family nonheme iron enzyme [bacterium]
MRKPARVLLIAIAFGLIFTGCEKKKPPSGEENKPPEISITAPHNGDTVFIPFDITVEATDDDSVVSVVFMVNGETLATLTSSPYQVSVADSSDTGNLLIVACAFDNDGDSACASVTVFAKLPEEPSDFRLDAPKKSSHNVYLVWKRFTSGVFYRYRVYMASGATVDSTDSMVAEIGTVGDTSLLVDYLAPTSTYSFRVYVLPLGGEPLKSNKVTVTTEEVPIPHDDHAPLVHIPADEFDMGDSWGIGGAEEFPVHIVHLSEYYIYKYEVTCAQYAEFIASGGYDDPEWWDPVSWKWKESEHINAPLNWGNPDYHLGEEFPNYPVTGISWYEAMAYARFVGKSLPTEAEWEFAARGNEGEDINSDGIPDGFKFPWGNEFYRGDSTFCNYKSGADGGMDSYDDGYRLTAPVGSYPHGASPFGVMDMAGNVAEWCYDWFDINYYSFSPYENPTGPETGTEKVVRGGSYITTSSIDLPGYNLRTTSRAKKSPETRRNFIGFRLVKRVR